MQVDECFQLGYVIKKHGLNGGVTALLDVDFPDEYKELESVFVEINNKLVPFFIDQISIKANKAQIKFEEVDSVEEAENLKSKALYLPLTALPDLEDGQFYYHQVIGYELVDRINGSIGKIATILTGPQQDLFEVDVKGKEALVPINDEIIIDVDHKNSIINVDLPEGLIELYLE